MKVRTAKLLWRLATRCAAGLLLLVVTFLVATSLAPLFFAGPQQAARPALTPRWADASHEEADGHLRRMPVPVDERPPPPQQQLPPLNSSQDRVGPPLNSSDHNQPPPQAEQNQAPNLPDPPNNSSADSSTNSTDAAAKALKEGPPRKAITPAVLAHAAIRFLRVLHPDSPTCEQVAEYDNLESRMPDDPVPQNCKLGIVFAGMPRAGSTMQYKMAQDLFLHNAHLHRDANDSVRSMYWDFHKHMRLKKNWEEKHLGEFTDRLRNAKDYQVFLTKTHEYKPQLLSLCKKTIVVTIRRDIPAIANSLLLAGWMDVVSPKGQQADFLRRFLEASINRYRCWTENADILIDSDYKDLFHNASHYLKTLADSSDLHVKKETIEAIAKIDSSNEANPSIPGSKGRELIPEQVADLGKALADNAVVATYTKQFLYNTSARVMTNT